MKNGIIQVKIFILEGSGAKISHTRILAKELERALVKKGAQVSFWSLVDRPLSFAIPEFHWAFDDTPDKSVVELGQEILGADGIVLASPLYHGSYSGVLKNALDCLWFDAFRDQPVTLLSHGSTNKRCAQPSEHLMTVVKTLYGYTMQTQVCTSKSEFLHEGEIPVRIEAKDILERIERQADELFEFATLLASATIRKDSD